jgi:hypothetical protein
MRKYFFIPKSYIYFIALNIDFPEGVKLGFLSSREIEK